MLGDEGASVVVVATDERQAGIVFSTAARMVELQPELERRIQVYQDRLVVPARSATFQVLPAVPKRLEGLDPTLSVLDEFGRIDREVYEVVGLASGKRTSSLLDAGQPGARGLPARARHRGVPAAETRESTFRRARLCQFADELADAWLPPRAWEDRGEERPIPDGADVVLALDGSFSQDATALVAAEVGEVPHLDVAGCWEPPPGRPDWRVPIVAVEDAIRAACRRWQIRQIVADPFRWARSLQILAAIGLRVLEFPQSAQRMTPATTGLYEAVVNRTVTHSGDPRLARHVANATVRTDSRTRIYKEHKHSTGRIDLAVCAIMAHSVAATIDPGLQLYWYEDAS